MMSTEKNKNPIISVFCHRNLCLLKSFSILSVRNARLSEVWNCIVCLISKNGDYREKQETYYISVLPPVFVFIKRIFNFVCQICLTIRCLKWYSIVSLISKNGDYREKQEPYYISVLPPVFVFIKSIFNFVCQVRYTIRCLKWYSMIVWIVWKNDEYIETQKPN